MPSTPVNQAQRDAFQRAIAVKKKGYYRRTPRDRAQEKLDEIAHYDAVQARLRADYRRRNPDVSS